MEAMRWTSLERVSSGQIWLISATVLHVVLNCGVVACSLLDQWRGDTAWTDVADLRFGVETDACLWCYCMYSV